MELILPGMLLVVVVYLMIKISTLQEDLKSIKYKLNRIESQMDLPEHPIDKDLRALLQEGKDIQAVKLVRETLRLSLLEGKQYVDALKEKEV